MTDLSAYKVVTGILGSLLLSLLAYVGGQYSMTSEIKEVRSEVAQLREAIRSPNPVVMAKLEGIEKRLDDLIKRTQ